MKIKIYVEGENEKETISFTNEELNNDNYVDLIAGERCFTVPIEDLYYAVKAFKDIAYDRMIREKVTDDETPIATREN